MTGSGVANVGVYGDGTAGVSLNKIGQLLWNSGYGGCCESSVDETWRRPKHLRGMDEEKGTSIRRAGGSVVLLPV